MTTKKSKKIFFSLFLFIGLFFLPISNVFAELEVQYPTITALGQSSGNVSDLPSYATYLIAVGMSVGLGAVFISLAIAGVMFILSPVDATARANAKDRVSGAISGLLLLVLTYLIISTINPQLNVFNTKKLPAADIPPPVVINPGVYLYQSGCSDKTVTPNTASITDLGPLKKKINNVNIVQDPSNNTYYISILYENPSLWGKCKEVATSGCQSVDSFASSASIHQYDKDSTSTSNGGGVYFYRKSCFNDGQYNDINSLISHCNSDSGGYYEVNPSGIYTSELKDLTFTGVPEDEQNCVEYDKNGNCCTKADNALGCDKDGRKPQTLGGENISSIIINGNYIVLLVYKSVNDSDSGPWTSCQEFPTIDDRNKVGPRQIKWQNIRNTSGITINNNNGSGTGTNNTINLGGIIPNYLVIIPIKS